MFLFQINTKSHVEILEDPAEEDVNKVAERLGIWPVGWIFTDLIADDLSKGTVKHFRGNIVRLTEYRISGFFFACG